MSNKLPIKRESGIELLRIICMLLIILHHFVCFRFRDMGTMNIFSFNNFIISFCWAGGKYGVVLFSMITGYFMIKSRISFKKIFKLELQVLFYSISLAILFVIFGGKVISREMWLTYLFPNYSKLYWFFSSYFLLYLCIPLLNFIFLRLEKEHYLFILGILFAIFILVPSFVFGLVFYDYYYLLFYYLVGGFIRLFLENIKEKKKFLVVSILFYLSIIGSSFFIQYLFHSNNVFVNYTYSFMNIDSILIFVSAVSLFMFFKNLNLKQSNLINKLASVSFGVYLFHEHTYMRKYLWFEVFDVNLFLDSPYFIFFTIFVAIFVFSIGGIYEYIRQVIFKYCYCIFSKIKGRIDLILNRNEC